MCQLLRREEKKVAVMTVAVNEPCGMEKVGEINKYSTLRKLYRVTAWITRFCHNISRRNKSDKREGALTLEEIVQSGGVYMTPGRLSHRGEFTPVPSCGSTFVYMIPPQKVMPARVATA